MIMDIPTADKFFVQYPLTARLLQSSLGEAQSVIHKAMVEFAKLHVEAALKAASEKGKAHNGGTWKTNDGPLASNPAYIDKQSILEAYPLTLIK